MHPPISVKITGTGQYLPEKIVSSTMLEEQLGLANGFITHRNGVATRHVADQTLGETSSGMAAKAAEMAIQNAGCNPEDLDLIVYASASPEFGLPDTAPLVQEKLGLGRSGIACFSIDSPFLLIASPIEL